MVKVFADKKRMPGVFPGYADKNKNRPDLLGGFRTVRLMMTFST